MSDLETQIKVKYRGRSGFISTAYVDENTGVGTDKHSDVPVILEWAEELDEWLQIDTWEWHYTHNLELIIVTEPNPNQPFNQRVQPRKKKSRKARRHG